MTVPSRRNLAALLLLAAVVGYAASMLLPTNGVRIGRSPMGWQLFLTGLCLFWVGFISLPFALAQGNRTDAVVALWCLCWLANPLFWWAAGSLLRALNDGDRPRRALLVGLGAAVVAGFAGVVDIFNSKGAVFGSLGYWAWASSMAVGVVAAVVGHLDDPTEAGERWRFNAIEQDHIPGRPTSRRRRRSD